MSYQNFAAIFELRGVDYLRKHPKFILSINFENFDKYYVCVQNFLSNLLSVEKECGLDRSRYELVDTCEHVLEGASTGSHGLFLLISRFYTLIRLNKLKKASF